MFFDENGDNPDDRLKYMISAFWNSNDYQSRVECLERWRGFTEDRKAAKRAKS